MARGRYRRDHFPSAPHAVRGHKDSISFEDGPLVFAMPVGEDWQKLCQRGLTADWQVLPTTSWAFAIAPDAKLKRVERAVGPVPFSRRDPPVVLVTEARPVTGWDELEGSATDVSADVSSRQLGKAVPVTLMPYAAPKLRLTSFPTSRS